MKKRIAAIVICCMLAFCIAACASKKNTPSGETPSDSVSASHSAGKRQTPTGNPSPSGIGSSSSTPGTAKPSSTNSGKTPFSEASATSGESSPTGSYVIKDPEGDDPSGPIILPDPGEPTVTFSTEGGFYGSPFHLTLSADSGYTIYYTMDGTDPKKNGKKYSTPILIERSIGSAGALTKSIAASFGYSPPASQITGTVIKAYATKGGSKTDTITNTYIVSSSFTSTYQLPCVSLSLAPNDFATKSGIYVSVMDHPFDPKERKIAFCEMFDKNGKKVSGQYHTNTSTGSKRIRW